MKKLMVITCALMTALIMAGCVSDSQSKDIADSYAKFISQERYMPLQAWDFGTNGTGTITYTGLVSMRVYAPLDKLSVIPDNPGTAREVVDGIVKVGAIAGAAYGIHTLSGSGASTSTVNNNPAP